MAAINEELRAGVEQALTEYQTGSLTEESGVLFAVVKRLAVAEDVCLVTGWTPMSQSERGKALYELWRRWHDLVGKWAEPSNHPHLDDVHIAELARQLDETRSRVLAKLFEDGEF